MATFRFKGFTETGVEAVISGFNRFVRDEDGFLRWQGQPPAVQPGTASFDIVRTDTVPEGEEIAPIGLWLRASNATGFSVSEPPGTDNVYDPSAHRITYVWELPDEGYQPIVTPNIPTAWRTHTADYGKEIAVVFTTPGTKIVKCFAFDDEGNWAEAEYVFGPGGQSGEIIDPEIYFAGNNTVCVSQANNFAGAPAGSIQVTTLTAMRNEVQTRSNAGANIVRVLFRRGDTWDNQTVEWLMRPGGGGLYINEFGAGAHRPRFIQRTQTGLLSLYAGISRTSCYANIELLGPYNASTETGRLLEALRGNSSGSGAALFHRVKIDGFDSVRLDRDGRANVSRILHDFQLGNWHNFGIFEVPGRMAIIWSDLAVPSDSLNGISNNPFGTGGNSNAMYFGNLHGCFRGGSHTQHISRSSFFYKGGWDRDGDFINNPPTAGQPSIRYDGLGYTSNRTHVGYTMCSFEAGGDFWRHANQFSNRDNTVLNTIVDKCVFCATSHAAQWLSITPAGNTIRNNYFIRPDVINTQRTDNITRFTNLATPTSAATALTTGANALTKFARDEIYNNTYVILGPSANINATNVLDPQPNLTPTGTLLRPDQLLIGNNIIVAPGLTTPVNASAPFTTEPLSGFSPRWGGNRWNFPPIGHTRTGLVPQITVGEAKVRDGGSNSDVAIGEWVAVDYPTYTGVCRGALDALLASTEGGVHPANIRSLILANSSQKHTLSLAFRILADGHWHDTTLYPDGRGGITIQFLTDRIRIQNNTDSAWPSATKLWLLLDLSDYLMGPQPGTISPSTIPFYVPTTGSSAIFSGTRTGLWAWDEFNRNVRAKSIGKNGVEVTGNNVIGAVA